MATADEFGFEQLRDQDGEPYPPADLPCSWLPHLWDEDAESHDKQHAAALCRTECPAIEACGHRRRQLKRLADGVWGGVIIRRDRPAVPEDPVVQQWRRDLNLRKGSGGR